MKQLNCKTNNTRNLRIINGTLALAAIHEKYWEWYYTSPTISTKQEFTQGRFEIRAALPNGKMLRPIIFMKGAKLSGKWPWDGQIDIMHMEQTPVHSSGIYFSRNGEPHKVETKLEVSENLNEFQTYVLEWDFI